MTPSATNPSGPEYVVPPVPARPQTASAAGWTRLLSGSVALLGSGVVSAVGFLLITSNRWRLIDPQVGVLVVLFVQWQMLGLTIAKLGIDQVVFAATTNDAGKRPDIGDHLTKRTLPLALVFSILVGIVFDPWAAVVCLISVLCDTESVIMTADLNGRGRYWAVAFGNILRYPIFFVVVFIIFGITGMITVAEVFAVFLATSVLRCLWLAWKESQLKYLPTVRCTTNLAMAWQQLLNYIVFRADQLLLATGVGTLIVTAMAPDFLQKYLFLAKYPELVSGVMVVLGAVFLPKLFLEYPIDRMRLRSTLMRHWPAGALYCLVVGGPIVILTQLWRGSLLHPGLLAAFGVAALLALPANILTYSMIRQGYVAGLIRNLSVSVVIGVALNAIGYSLTTPVPLVITVPVQLLAFTTLGLATNWGERKPLYGG